MREIININTKWAFSKEASQVPEKMPENWYWVNLPHTWNAIDGQDGDNDYYRGTCYYAKIIRKSELPRAQQYYLELCGANSSADVYVNGKKAAHHDGGYSTWRVNLTDLLTEETLLVIAVDNGTNDRVYPQMADFTFYGGLYRDVNIIAVPEAHFDLDYYGGSGLQVTPVKGNGIEACGGAAAEEDTACELSEENVWRVNVKTYVSGMKEGQRVQVTVYDQEGVAVAWNVRSEIICSIDTENVADTANDSDTYAGMQKEQQAQCLEFCFTLDNVHLWNGKKDPYLYTAKAELMADTEVLDTVSARFGCRTFEIDPERGFLLNGESYPLRGVSRHQDRWGIGNALLPEHHEEDMELILEMGANTVRLAHYQHDQYFYDLCDENGLVIWAEIPYISQHMSAGRENTISQMTELIVQNYNHPSICVWGLSNEITMQGDGDPDLLENHRILNKLVKELDPTRKTTLAALSMCPIDAEYLRIPDCISYNHYFGWYGGDTSMNGPWFDHFHEKYPQIPVGVSEYGCEALNWHTSDPQQGDYTEEYQAYYHEELIKQLYTRPYIWATHVWNMFDFGADARNEGGENGQNHKGLVTFDRKYKKDAFYAYKAWLSDEPFVHICGKRYVDRVEDVTKVTVYSNLPEVELFANGISLGVQKAPNHFFYFQVPNVGETKLVALAGINLSQNTVYCDESFLRKVDTFNEDYRLKEKGAVLNWFDINAPEGYFSLNDKMGEVLANAEAAKVVGRIFEGFASGQDKQADTRKESETGAEKTVDAKTVAGFEFSESMMQMMGGFTVLRLTEMLGMAGIELTKEQLLEMNEELNQIKK